MTEENKPLKVEFAPGAFDDFEGTQEELDELIAEIQTMFDGKSRAEIEAMSHTLTEEDFEDMSDDVKLKLARPYEDLEEEFKRKLQ